jgi:UPF0716 protein FxsA
MLARLFFLFTIVPIIELYLLIKAGSALGALNTVALLVATALLGAFLVRLEGFRTLSRITESMSQGIVPAEELIDGLLILAAGVLLITPGFFTDIVSLLLLIPFTRVLVKRWLRWKFDRMASSGKGQIHFYRRYY